MGITDQMEEEMNTEAAKESTAQTEQAAEAKNDSMRQAYTFAAGAKLRECKYCRVMIPKKAKICPNCKMVLKKYTGVKAAAAVLVVATAGYGLYAYAGLLPDYAVPAWMEKKPSEPVLSVTTVEAPETAAGAQIVEPVDVAVAADLSQPATAEAEPEERIVWSVNDMTDVEPESENALSLTVGQDILEAAKTPDENEDAVKDMGTDSEEDAEGGKIKTTGNTVRRDSAEAEENGNTAGRGSTEAEENSNTAGRDSAEAEENGSTAGRDSTEAEENGKTTAHGSEEPEESGRTTAHGGKDPETADNPTDTEEEQDDPAGAFPEDLDVNEAAFRADCVRRDYKELLRNEDYLGTAVWLEAEVICQVDGGLFDENIYYLCMEEDSSGIERYYIIRDDRAEDQLLILEGDVLTIYGRLFGNCKLPASLIETRPTVPAISMLSCDLQE